MHKGKCVHIMPYNFVKRDENLYDFGLKVSSKIPSINFLQSMDLLKKSQLYSAKMPFECLLFTFFRKHY